MHDRPVTSASQGLQSPILKVALAVQPSPYSKTQMGDGNLQPCAA